MKPRSTLTMAMLALLVLATPALAKGKKKTKPAMSTTATANPSTASPATPSNGTAQALNSDKAAVGAGTAGTSGPAQAKPVAGLESVLDQLDQAAATFRSAEADFVWEQYQKVVDEKDVQKGTAFFVRHEKDTHMAADITEPEKKVLLFSDGKIRFYQPRIDQVTEYDTGAKKEEVESFLVLGFGGRGHDLQKSFTVKLDGFETIDGV